MKNISIFLNIVLLIAVGVLYYLHFSTGKSDNISQTTNNEMEEDQGPVASAIAYVNIDTLLDNYIYHQEIEDQLIKAQKDAESNISYQLRQLQERYREAQEKFPYRTERENMQEEQEIMQEQQRLQKLQQQKSQELVQKEMELNTAILENITSYLEKYNQSRNYDYILAYSNPGSILLANDSLEITKSVLRGLNEEYNQKSQETGTQPDAVESEK